MMKGDWLGCYGDHHDCGRGREEMLGEGDIPVFGKDVARAHGDERLVP